VFDCDEVCRKKENKRKCTKWRNWITSSFPPEVGICTSENYWGVNLLTYFYLLCRGGVITQRHRPIEFCEHRLGSFLCVILLTNKQTYIRSEIITSLAEVTIHLNPMAFACNLFHSMRAFCVSGCDISDIR